MPHCLRIVCADIIAAAVYYAHTDIVICRSTIILHQVRTVLLCFPYLANRIFCAAELQFIAIRNESRI